MPPIRRRRSTSSSLFAPPGTGPYLPLRMATSPQVRDYAPAMRYGPAPLTTGAPLWAGPAALPFENYRPPLTLPLVTKQGGYPQGYARNLTHQAMPGPVTPGATYAVPGMAASVGAALGAVTGLTGGARGVVAGAAGVGGAGGTAGRAWKPPPGIDAGWYSEFQRQHGGENPEDFYGRTGEGLAEALADQEWSRGFAQMNGRPPSQDDWEAWWYSSRGRRWAAMSDAERREARRQSRKRGRKEWAREKGWTHWNEYEAWVQEGKAEPGMSKAEAEEFAKTKEEEELAKQRGPLYEPPRIVWR